eukprot:2986118-Alexandrium_andersonii.AAC.1
MVPKQPLCSKCGREVDPMKVQLVGKSGGVWKCNKCNVRHVSLVRLFGGWPPDEFKSLSEAEQQAFWSAEVDGGSAGLKKLAVDTLVKQRIETFSSAEK